MLRHSFVTLLWCLVGVSVVFILADKHWNHHQPPKHLHSFAVSYADEKIRSSPQRITNESSVKSFYNSYWCEVKCKTGVPCEYLDEVDFRIIVMTYDRTDSLNKCLDHILKLDTLGDKVSVEIWIDRSKKGEISQPVLTVAEEFRGSWNASGKGRACVHMQDSNAFIGGQWTDTWRPKPGTKEIGLILEDDVDVAPMAYRWLKAVHNHYGNRSDLMGYTLQMQAINFFQGNLGAMQAPKEYSVFMYGVLGTWGFAPHPTTWRLFQDWVHVAKTNKLIKPYVEGIKPTEWYKLYERKGVQDRMWEIWHIYFSHINQLYCVYSNLLVFTGRDDTLLSFNRKEPGLHFGNSSRLPVSTKLMATWNSSYGHFPQRTIQFKYNGSVERMV